MTKTEQQGVPIAGDNSIEGRMSIPRQRVNALPKLPLLSTQHLFNTVDKDFSQFALSPLTFPAAGRSAIADFTPVTAFKISDRPHPTIPSPSSGPGLSLLDRFLEEHYTLPTPDQPVLIFPENAGGSSSQQISSDLKLPAPWSAVIGSPLDSQAGTLSPVLGEGPAEMLDREDCPPPTDTQSDAGTDNTFIEEDYGSRQASRRASMLFDGPTSRVVLGRRRSFPGYETTKTTFLVHAHHLHKERAPNSAPLETKQSESMTHSNSAKADRSNIQHPSSVPEPDSRNEKTVEVGTSLNPLPFTPPPAPTTDTFQEQLPKPVARVERSVYDPPPAPTLDRFPVDLPASPMTSRPAPVDTSLSPSLWQKVEESTCGGQQPRVVEELYPFLLGSPTRTSPPPAPTRISFDVELPLASVRNKPSPIKVSSPKQEKGKAKQIRFDPPDPSEVLTPVGPKMVRFAISPLPGADFRIPVSPLARPMSKLPSIRVFPQHDRSASTEGSGFATSEPSASAVFNSNVAVDATPLPPYSPASMPRGRSPNREDRGIKDSQFWRSTRSQSPKRSARMHNATQETESIPILPNTVYDPMTRTVYATDKQLESDKYIILKTYFKKGADTSTQTKSTGGSAERSPNAAAEQQAEPMSSSAQQSARSGEKMPADGSAQTTAPSLRQGRAGSGAAPRPQ